MKRYAVMKSLDEIKLVLAAKSEEKRKIMESDVLEARKKLEEEGLENTKKMVAEKVKKLEFLEGILEGAPAALRSRMKQEIKESEKNSPENWKKAMEALKKKNHKQFDFWVNKIYQDFLKNETVEFIREKFNQSIVDAENEQIEMSRKVAGKKFRICGSREDDDGYVNYNLDSGDDNDFSVTPDLIKEILEEK